ncbi:hypothetical protein BZG02_19125 [Labilibaculum filiforme]|uniref:Uncharacterized protein n=1 Tax=Labilibaculum filiforme TaxID=1940526 RepID=A0A2N3HR05_9BACT|nr:hypothetical protein [Labilibaculum filiforme]PKQ60470.1 hypothetical protein BZG02_19125 [Labilibaculum filiforme]
MKTLIKKYWYILILLITLPIVLNLVLRLNAPFDIVGNAETWLAFWSTYSASIIGSLITLFVLFRTLDQNKLSLSETLKQNEINNKESKNLQIAIYQKRLEERRIKELTQTFKESLHFINHSQIHYNQRLIITGNYTEASKFFISETARCKQTISTLLLDLIPIRKSEELDDYRETYTDLLELYLILSIQIMNITSILIGQSFAEKKNLFHITITFNTSITVFSKSDIDDINRAKSEDQFVSQLTALIQKQINEFSTKANNIEKGLMRKSKAIIDDLLKQLSAI